MSEETRWYSAQRAILGCLLVYPEETCAETFHKLRPEDFGDPSLRTVFSAARDLWLQQRPVDPVTVQASLGSEYDTLLKDLIVMTATSTSWETYVSIIREQARLTRIQALALRITQEQNLEACGALLSEAAAQLAEGNRQRAKTYTELISDYLDRQGDPNPPQYLDWGIEALNRQLTISPGRFVVLGADSSVGKTALALQLGINIARTGKRVGFFSYETSHADAADRILANTADVAMVRTKRKTLNAKDFIAVMEEGQKSAEIPFTLEESADCTVDDLRALTLAGRYEVIFIDYVQLIPSNQTERWQAVTEVSMALHRMAQTLGVTVIALSQVTPPEKSKGKTKRRPIGREDLRESRQLLHDAEAILILDLVDPDDFQGLRSLRIAKNKDGALGYIQLEFDPYHMRFSYVPPYEDEDQQKTRERNEKMDRNREARKEKARRKADAEAEAAAQPLVDLAEQEGGELPF